MKPTWNKIAVVLMFLLASTLSFAQPKDNDSRLADHYFNKGEFSKAEEYYEKVYKKYKHSVYFEKYYLCLFYQEKFDDAEKLCNKRIRQDPFDLEAKFLLGQVYEETDRQEDANALYDDMIEEVGGIQSRIQSLGKAFKIRGKYNYALKTFEKGRKLMKTGYQFQLELAEIYSLLDQQDKMIAEYLNLLDYSPVYLKTVQTYLSRIIDFEEDKEMVDLLRVELLDRVQKHPDEDHYNEMLIWFYLHKREFPGAVIQAKALDKRKNLRGKRVFEIGEVCEANESYSSATKAYQYVADLGAKSPYWERATERLLNIKFLQVVNQKTYTKAQLRAVSEEFESALTLIGKSSKTLGIIMQLGRIYAFYLDQPKKGEDLISGAMELNISSLEKAELKILLGDIYVVSGDIWNASLLYMQVEKQYSEDIIGHEAKFKNARVFYYEGEFEYAKAQLDVLKASTSKLIANDAMQLSLLLQDNLGLDTTQAPVQIYAHADLLLQQNKFSQALYALDSLEKKYPFHSLSDEVLFKKAEIYERQQNYEKAIELYNTVCVSYSFDILADDAAIRIARIYDYKLDDSEKAKEYYKKIMFEFKASLYVAESRERYNQLNNPL